MAERCLIKVTQEMIIHPEDIQSAELLGETLSINLWSNPEQTYCIPDPNRTLFNRIAEYAFTELDESRIM